MLDIQKISAAEMRVTLRLSRPHCSGIDRDVSRRSGGILGIEDQ
jgi:hypothetical protein